MTNSTIQVYITKWCRDCSRVIKYLQDLQINIEIIDIDFNKQGEEFVRSVNRGYRSVPTLSFPDGTILVEPSQMDLEQKLKTYRSASY